MLDDYQKAFYWDNGYLLIENVVGAAELAQLQAIACDFIEASREVTESNDIYDLDSGHSAQTPRLNRIKLPHKHHPYFDHILKNQG